MRLLDCSTLDFVEYDNDYSIPQYAILSHTWANDEVSYKDMRKYRSVAETKDGFQKIKKCAEIARWSKIDYIWVDTCNINKSSSAELSEAINSMYRWYKKAKVCYTYLADVPNLPPQPSDKESASKSLHSWTAVFKKSRWFTRGWTLQELIAPRDLIFYSSDWRKVGTKKDLAFAINEATGIPLDVLLYGDLKETSLAQRMSWASTRDTTRVEDRAYCLMGIFDVNMPMLYGEGEKSFTRLQDEIIRNSDDMSIFAWVDPKASFASYRGLLARSPANFARCRDMLWFRVSRKLPPHQVTNKGIRIDSKLDEFLKTTKNVEREVIEFTIPLFGVFQTKRSSEHVGIRLRRVGADQYARIDPDKLHFYKADTVNPWGELSTFYIRQHIEMESFEHTRAKGVSLRLYSRMLSVDFVDVDGKEAEKKDFYPFSAPAWQSKPPCIVFLIAVKSTPPEKLRITVDSSRKWNEMTWTQFMDGDWDGKPQYSPSRNRMTFTKKSRPEVQVTMKRGLSWEESLLTLTINARPV